MKELIPLLILTATAALLIIMEHWRADRWRRACEQSGARETMLIQALTAMLFDGGPDARRKAWAALRETTVVLTEEASHAD